MSEIINIEDHIPMKPMKPMVALMLYLDNKGEPVFELTWAAKDFIEQHETISDRFTGIKLLVEGAIGSLDDLAEEFKNE